MFGRGWAPGCHYARFARRRAVAGLWLPKCLGRRLGRVRVWGFSLPSLPGRRVHPEIVQTKANTAHMAVGSHGWISASTSVELPPGVCKATACMSIARRNQTDLPTPTWPSLYDPLIEFHNLEHRAPVQPGGRYLTQAGGMRPVPLTSLTHHSKNTHRRIPLHLLLDARIPFGVFLNHWWHCVFQYHLPLATRQEWGHFGLADPEPCWPTSTPVTSTSTSTSDDPADTTGVCAIA